MKSRNQILKEFNALIPLNPGKQHQATIDLCEDIVEQLHNDEFNLPFEHLIHSLHYDVSNLLEVMNPEFSEDIRILQELDKILSI